MRDASSVRVLTIALGAFSAAWAWSGSAAAQPAANAGAWIVDARLRYESVSQDGVDDAAALTLRARFGYETPAFHGVRGLVEAEGVGQLNDEFNDTLNGHTSRATIPDPEAFELNRLQLTWSGAQGARVVVGRQRIILNNARFIGNGGFRQNEQTFDAVRLEARPMPHLALTYLYLDSIRRTLGDDSPQGVWHSDSHVFEADIDGGFGKLSGYALLLDFSNAAPQSSQTYGVRWQRAWEVGGGYNLRATLEAAQQSDYGNAPASFDLGYQGAELVVRRGDWSSTLGGERLEGNGAQGFATPLATLHAFQGWADVFVSTPGDGVRDLYIGATYNTQPWPAAQPVAISLTAHNFTDDSGGRDFGNEFDASARLTLTSHIVVELAAATFNGEDARFADRDKVWVSFEYKL